MQLTVREAANTTELSSVLWNRLVKLKMPVGILPIDTIGYLISSRRFVVIAGAPLGVYDANSDTPVEVLKSGTLMLEIECN